MYRRRHEPSHVLQWQRECDADLHWSVAVVRCHQSVATHLAWFIRSDTDGRVRLPESREQPDRSDPEVLLHGTSGRADVSQQFEAMGVWTRRTDVPAAPGRAQEFLLRSRPV